jgi:transposase InsO family protein
VIFHSDRGCQYTSQQFAALADKLGVHLSVGRTGQCWDNALAESFFATIKREWVHTTAWPSRAAARTAIFDFIEDTQILGHVRRKMLRVGLSAVLNDLDEDGRLRPGSTLKPKT